MKSLIWLDLAPRSGASQMAIDRAMVDVAIESNRPIIRLYRWSCHTISFGANEAADRHWHRDLIERTGIAVVRRPTGGRAVWHDPEDLTYSWAGESGGYRGTKARYLSVHRILADAVSTEAELAPPPSRLPGLSAGACFDVPVGGEVLLGGRKVIGSAQVTIGAGLLQHGAIARRDRSASLDPFRRNLAPAAASVSQVILPASDELAGAIAERFAGNGAEVAGRDHEVTAEVLSVSSDHLAHFSNPDWTWRR